MLFNFTNEIFVYIEIRSFEILRSKKKQQQQQQQQQPRDSSKKKKKKKRDSSKVCFQQVLKTILDFLKSYLTGDGGKNSVRTANYYAAKTT